MIGEASATCLGSAGVSSVVRSDDRLQIGSAGIAWKEGSVSLDLMPGCPNLSKRSWFSWLYFGSRTTFVHDCLCIRGAGVSSVIGEGMACFLVHGNTCEGHVVLIWIEWLELSWLIAVVKLISWRLKVCSWVVWRACERRELGLVELIKWSWLKDGVVVLVVKSWKMEGWWNFCMECVWMKYRQCVLVINLFDNVKSSAI
jgi:hypothetical protein